MENTFIPIIRKNESRLIEALKQANLQAMQQSGIRHAVYIWSDEDITTLSFPAEKDGGYTDEAPCVLVGSFCYLKPVNPAEAVERIDYPAIVQNCVMVLSHFH